MGLTRTELSICSISFMCWFSLHFVDSVHRNWLECMTHSLFALRMILKYLIVSRMAKVYDFYIFLLESNEQSKYYVRQHKYLFLTDGCLISPLTVEICIHLCFPLTSKFNQL